MSAAPVFKVAIMTLFVFGYALAKNTYDIEAFGEEVLSIRHPDERVLALCLARCMCFMMQLCIKGKNRARS
jgi:hypothetical protein